MPRGDKSHVGVPIGGVAIMTLSTTLPPNFRWMDGNVINEPRSPLNGQRTKDWNDNCFLGIGVGSGSIINASVTSKSKSVTLKAENIPLMTLPTKWNVDFKADGSSALQGANYTQRRTDDAESLDQPSLRRGLDEWDWDGYSARSGNQTNHLIINGDYDKGEGVANISHTHNVTLSHESNHTIEAASSTDYLLSVPESSEAQIDLASNMTSTRGESITYQSVPNHFNVRYAMRVY